MKSHPLGAVGVAMKKGVFPSRLAFELDHRPLEGWHTAHAGVPLLIEAFRTSGAGSVLDDPPLDVALRPCGHGESSRRDVLADHGAAAGPGAVTDLDRGDEGVVGAGLGVLADLGAVLGGPVDVGEWSWFLWSASCWPARPPGGRAINAAERRLSYQRRSSSSE